MKNYSSEIAARKLVSKKVSLGVSRHQTKEKLAIVTSVGTARNHRNSLKVTADWLLSSKGKHLDNMNESDAIEYLTLRSLTAGQSTVDLARQAMNLHLFSASPIPFFPSTHKKELVNRAYTKGEVELLLKHANSKLGFSIRLAVYAGLRAFELLTIAPAGFFPESDRDAWAEERFLGRGKDCVFVVHGKGGLRRQVRVSQDLADELAQHLLLVPKRIKDREVIHLSYFDLTGGANFSSQFSKLSNKVLGSSRGAHGLRHTFAQQRLRELICCGLSYERALQVLSNELGHFATTNTLAYLRH
ncbi:integrase domain-containing protein [Rhodoferax mekongensis]|uniref:integrase domain-containing protein n=1 Tax=Rhodoferax mekongensis TaxID=3068341 RepID=UPI0028BD62F2|nr:integrase domain-containing protein [Rhodoferax sp. TBRC 17199]MDT7517120.1 integrase domain-containing protein [Rhodoferax sp. TBRC 17199]